MDSFLKYLPLVVMALFLFTVLGLTILYFTLRLIADRLKRTASRIQRQQQAQVEAVQSSLKSAFDGMEGGVSSAMKDLKARDEDIKKSGAKEFKPTELEKLSFDDIAGCDEAIAHLRQICRWLRKPKWYRFFAAKLPRGVLLAGGPGVGKTLLAKVVASEADATFFHITGSNFVEMYVGVGASRVRSLFNELREAHKSTGKPVILFIDEIDAIGGRRDAGVNTGSRENDQTLNQLLAEMDGFEPNTGILVIGATNRPDVLDEALVRPGRFDNTVNVELRTREGRKAIFAIHTRGKRIAPDVDFGILADRTVGFSGAEIAAACNEAAILAANRADTLEDELGEGNISESHLVIGAVDLSEGIDIARLGHPRTARAAVMSQDEMRQTAYHEAAHAVVARANPHGAKVGKLTVMPRDKALGYTELISSETSNMTEPELNGRLAALIAGRRAQVKFLATCDVGASNDFQRATELARRMVIEFGMSDLGPLGLDASRGGLQDVGPALKDAIDNRWLSIITSAQNVADELLDAHRDAIVRIAETLLARETLQPDEFERLWNDEPLDAIN